MMGDRAIIYVNDAPAAIYTQWGGHEAIDSLKSAIPSMRKGDPEYSLARLTGVLHCQSPNRNTGLGIVQKPEGNPPTDDDSPGDAGVVVYDCDSGEVRCYHGYLAKEHPDSINIGIPPK